MQRLLLTLTCLLATAACGDDTGEEAATDSSSTGRSSDSSGAASDSSGAASDSGASATTADPTHGSGSSGSSSTSSNPASTGSVDGGSSTTGEALCPDVGDPCTQCEASSCSAAYCDCFNNGSCVLLAQCTAKCDIGDTACNQACWSMYPEGISDGALLTHCAATICMPECGPYAPLTECQLCLYSECQDEMNVCVSNPGCTALLACLDECENPGCENGCYALYPGGLADSGPVGECAQDACLMNCI